MVSALLEPAVLLGGALALVAVVVAALSAMCLLAAARTGDADRPLPQGLVVLTAAGIQVMLVLVLAMFALQAAIEILAAAITP